MDLTTRCPKCGTVFQAGLSDLQLRKGYIRCVQCAHIFDGYAEVVSDASETPASPAAPRSAAAQAPSAPSAPFASSAPFVPPASAAPPAPPAPSAPSVPSAPYAASPSFTASAASAGPAGPAAEPPPQVIRSGRPVAGRPQSEPAPVFRIGVAPWPDDRPEPRLGQAAGGPAPRPVEEILADEGWVPDAGAAPVFGRAEPPPQEAPFVVEARPGHRSQGGSAAPLLRDEDAPGWWDALLRFGAWLLFILLLVLLAAQAVYVYRAQIARMVPALRPALERACVPLRCQVPYARDIAHIAITGSALKAADAGAAAGRAGTGRAEGGRTEGGADGQASAEQHFVLHATLRNRAERPQEWPTLILDLKDAAGTLLVRRNLSPADYLGAARAAEPFAALSEVLVRVPLTVSGVRVNGYQLDLFYP